MRPDPWQIEKSRRYQAKRCTKLIAKEERKKGKAGDNHVVKEKASESKDSKEIGGFKFISPSAPSTAKAGNASTQNGSDSEAEDEDEEYDYDITNMDDFQLVDFSVDLSKLDLEDDLEIEVVT